MKNIILILTLLVGIICSAQSDKLNYSDVIKVDGVSKNELYDRAMNWFANSFRNANNVIQLTDKENGQITAKALFVYNPNFFVGSGPVKGYIRYTVSVYLKDGRYKYEITDFTHEPSNSPNAKSVGIITNDLEYPGKEKRAANQKWMNNTWQDINKQIEANITPIVASLKDGMNKATESKNEDW